MDVNITLVLKTVLEDYALPLGGDHGVAHWARVFENGLRLAEETGAKTKEMIQCADGRSCFRVIPTFVLSEWGIDLEKERAW